MDEDPFYEQVAHEIKTQYRLDTIPFQPGDVVLDIGAHVGLVSVYLAKQHPDIRVYAYEPVPENYRRLCAHVRLNETMNVRPHKFAVTGDGGHRLMARCTEHTGGATAFHDSDRDTFTVRSTTVPAILKRYRIARVRLLKLDCEGAEHEILADSEGWIHKVQHIRGEIHDVQTEHSAALAAASVPDVHWMYA